MKVTKGIHRCVGGFVAAAMLIFLVGCSPADTSPKDFITETLKHRAKHLKHVDRIEIVAGLTRAEQATGVDALLLLAVVEEESHYKAGARSRRGAVGLLQVRPATGRDVARRNGISWTGESTLLDPSANLLIGATYLAELHQRFESWDLALTAYNRGPTSARRLASRGRQPSSRYAARVLRRAESLRAAAARGRH